MLPLHAPLHETLYPPLYWWAEMLDVVRTAGCVNVILLVLEHPSASVTVTV